MSLISDRHNVNSFVAGKSAPLTGQRLARIGYKKSKENEAKGFQSVCVSLPPVSLTEQDFQTYEQSFKTLIQDALETAQDGIIRSMYESSGATLKSVGDSDLSIVQCLAFLEAEKTGGRLTKEFLDSWFEANVAENLMVVIADKLGFNELNEMQMVTIRQKLNAYKGLISSLAGNKTILQPQHIKGIRQALDISAVDDDVSAKLKNKLTAMENQPRIEELLELE